MVCLAKCTESSFKSIQQRVSALYTGNLGDLKDDENSIALDIKELRSSGGVTCLQLIRTQSSLEYGWRRKRSKAFYVGGYKDKLPVGRLITLLCNTMPGTF